MTDKSYSKKESQTETQQAPQYTLTPQTQEAPPPTYTLTPLSPSETASLTSAFSTLSLPSLATKLPQPTHCLAHLKLLYAFHALKLEIGFTDGLFGIWDVRGAAQEELAKAREKRWALYLARAVERFEVWWVRVLCVREVGATRLKCEDVVKCTGVFRGFTAMGTAQCWTGEMLPPLDVLMVWHSFMLNPRKYLEDCAKFGLKDTWATGLPWEVVNQAIDTDFNYCVSDACKEAYTAATGNHWNNIEDPLTKSLQCPRCPKVHEIPWTEVGNNDKSSPEDKLEFDGHGYGDQSFSLLCDRCGVTINHDLLCVSKFKKDVENLMLNDWPLGGTLLAINGMLEPEVKLAQYGYGDLNPWQFPNRMIKLELRSQILELVNDHPNPTMEDVKVLIETTLKDKKLSQRVNGTGRLGGLGGLVLNGREKMAIRKMMARYWDNHSIFALELGGAVLRQGTFVEKMRGLDWLHSPAATQTMERLLYKYENFIGLMKLYQGKTVVPTLDVDLAWHTAQLSPKQYYDYTYKRTSTFIDHDDKISEDKLSDAFEWTTETYERRYGQLYSECTCWYCEAIRGKAMAKKVFGTSKHEKLYEEFHASGNASLCQPNNSAHISAHNAVRVHDTDTKTQVHTRQRMRQRQDLDKAYEKACRRAEAKGRKRPSREEFQKSKSMFGYGYMSYAPFLAVPLVVGGGAYYVGNAYGVNIGPGMSGACASGSCGGGCAGGADASGGNALGAGATCSSGAGGLSVAGCGGAGGGCGGGS